MFVILFIIGVFGTLFGLGGIIFSNKPGAGAIILALSMGLSFGVLAFLESVK
jgi:hypothetical protein